MTELQDKSKAQAEQIDELHKQMAEQKMQAGGKLFVEDAGVVALLALAATTNLAEIAKAGGIPLLVALMRDGTDQQKASALSALSQFAQYSIINKLTIAQAGGIPPLVALMRDGNDEQKYYAVEALSHIANVQYGNGEKLLPAKEQELPDKLITVAIAKAGGIPLLVALLVRDGKSSTKFRHSMIYNAYEALRHLAENHDNKVAIAKAKIEAGVYDSIYGFHV